MSGWPIARRGCTSVANARSVAAAREILTALFPVNALIREQRVDLAITDDGRPRADRATGVLAPEARPVVAADEIFPDGFDADDLQELLESLPTNLATLTDGMIKVVGGVIDEAVANTDYLPVSSPTATGTLTTANLTATGDALLGNGGGDIVQIHGHFKLKGTTPGITAGAALGTGGSVGATIAGVGQAGEVQLTAGNASFGTGTAATITFNTARPDTNYHIQLTPRGLSAGINAVQAYATRNTVNDWLIRFSVAPTSGLVLSYAYLVVEWTT